MIDALDVYEEYKRIKEETKRASGVAGYIVRHEFYEEVLSMIAKRDTFAGGLARAALGQDPQSRNTFSPS